MRVKMKFCDASLHTNTVRLSVVECDETAYLWGRKEKDKNGVEELNTAIGGLNLSHIKQSELIKMLGIGEVWVDITPVQ